MSFPLISQKSLSFTFSFHSLIRFLTLLQRVSECVSWLARSKHLFRIVGAPPIGGFKYVCYVQSCSGCRSARYFWPSYDLMSRMYLHAPPNWNRPWNKSFFHRFLWTAIFQSPLWQGWLSRCQSQAPWSCSRCGRPWWAWVPRSDLGSSVKMGQVRYLDLYSNHSWAMYGLIGSSWT